MPTTTTKDFYQWCIAERTSEVDEAAALVHTVETTVSEALAASFGLYGKRTHR